jgi:hypothetical protein
MKVGRSSAKRYAPFIFIVSLLLTGIAWRIMFLDETRDPPMISQGEPDPIADPILSETEAISRSSALLPASAQVDASVARQVTTSTLDLLWLGESEVGWTIDTPVWIVGIEATGLSVGTSNVLPFGAPVISDTRAVAGMFVAWDANSGQMLVSGSLTAGPGVDPREGGRFPYQKILMLPTDSRPIEHATAMPTSLDP